MLNWLLGFLPAPIRYGLMAVGVVCYLVALIQPGSTLAGFCMFIAGVTGATTLFSAAKESIKAAEKLKEAVKAEPEKPAIPPDYPQYNEGHSQESADQYQGGIFNP